MTKLCVEKCKFQKWVPGKFCCDLYEQNLMYVIVDEGVRFLRCRECELEDREYSKIETD